MHYRRLGKTDLQLSTVGLGGWALGGATDWGDTPFAEAQSAVQAALDAGINVIDTAPIYGSSEEVLGRILQGRRQEVILATKCGLVKNGSWTDHDLRPQTITAQLETSLRLLQTDFIDIYFVHYLDPQIPWQSVLESLAQFKKQGKIRHIGVCNIPPEILAQMAQTGLIDCVQDELSLLHPHKAAPVLEICRAHQLGFVAYGSLCGGILSGKYKRVPNLRRADARNYFYKCYRDDAFVQAQSTVKHVQELSAQHHTSCTAVALAWVLAQPGVTCALAGARRAEQVLQNAQAADVYLSAEELCTLLK
ncbi:MAG: aldo/keto reductase [Elusimicrobiaceae bacterium]|nr:aldo/keto reductase [Elusimicrobiaceae bacterium]